MEARTRYEFGVKVSIATTNEWAKGGQFVLGAMALPGRPYDGQTLSAQIDQAAKLTGAPVARAYADRGYRGRGIVRAGLDVIISHTRDSTVARSSCSATRAQADLRWALRRGSIGSGQRIAKSVAFQ